MCLVVRAFCLVSLVKVGFMTLDPNSSEPPYKQLAALVARRIEVGEYAPGSALPSGAQLAREAGVSRVTVQNALKLLKADGLVVGRQGSGVFVATGSPVEDGFRSQLLALTGARGPVRIDSYGRSLDSLIRWLASGADGVLAGRPSVELRAIVSSEAGDLRLEDLRLQAQSSEAGASSDARRLVAAAEAGGVDRAAAAVVRALTLPEVTFDLALAESSAIVGDEMAVRLDWFDQEWDALREFIDGRMADEAQVGAESEPNFGR